MDKTFEKIRRIFCKLFDFKKKTIEITKTETNYTEAQLNVFNNIKPGDLVICEMPLPKEQLEKIDKNHRVRPYLVLYKNIDSFCGLYCSSNFRKYDKNYQNMVLNVEKYKLKHFVDNKLEDVDLELIDVSHEYTIDIDKIRHILVSLNDKDINKVNNVILKNNKKHNKNTNLIENGKEIFTYDFYKRVENKKSKKKNKRKNQLKDNKLYCKHIIGGIYYDINKVEVVYLFTRFDKDYCIRIDEFSTICPNIIKDNIAEDALVHGRINDNDIFDIFELICANDDNVLNYFDTNYILKELE